MNQPRIDFAKVLEEIAYLLGDPAPGQNPELKVPASQEKLAKAVDMPRGTVRMYMDGSEPGHLNGEKLLAIWCKLSGKARTFAPIDSLGGFSAGRTVQTAIKPITTRASPRDREGHGNACLTASLAR